MERTNLEHVRIESPCPKRWSELVGGDERRYCGDCRLHVLNLSALTRRQGERALDRARADGGRVCATFVRDVAGAIVTRPTRLSSFGRGVVRGLAAAASFALGFVSLAGLSGCTQAPGPGDGALGACVPSLPDDGAPTGGAVTGRVGPERPEDTQVLGGLQALGEVVVEEEPGR